MTNDSKKSGTRHISGTTRVYMVVGNPVHQVQAPAIFNRIFERFQVDAVLVPMQVEPDMFQDFARIVLRSGNVDGLWVTVPHKPTLMPTLDKLDTAARMAGSVNAVLRHADGTLEGGMFDGSGFVSALRYFGIDPTGVRVLLIGTGGAGAAIASALLQAGIAELALHDLGGRAKSLMHRLDDTRVSTPGADPAGFDLIVNATPLGLHPADALPVDVERIDVHARVVDILMKHEPTPLLRACAARGIQAFPGFEMLVQQVPDYLRFFGMADIADQLKNDLSDIRKHILAH